MIPRRIEQRLMHALSHFPVLTILGPRQAGKTTLVRNVLPGFSYANLEQPEIRSFAQSDPKSFLLQYPAPAIFDEIQRVPGLLSWIQTLVDEHGGPGQYVLTGSNMPELGQAVSQSLAGRTALLTLYPLSLEELRLYGQEMDLDQVLVQGLLPRVHSDKLPWTQAYLDYCATYVERDVRQTLNIKNLARFETFLRLLAGRIGQLLNLHSLSGDVGVSSTTLAEWLSVLEASFVIFRLQPYHANLGKRLVKSPKVYFVEPGLAAALLQIETPAQMARDPLRGALFENLVVVEMLKGLQNRGLHHPLTFYRDHNGQEADLVLEVQRRPLPMEIKSARTWLPEWQKKLAHVQSLLPSALPGMLVYGGEERRGGLTIPAWIAQDMMGD